MQMSSSHVEASLPSHGRFDYSPIVKRSAFTWPEGKTLAVYIGFNIEHFAFGEGLGAQLAPSTEPDVLNWAWREYGNRVGAWRCLEIFEALGLPIGALINSSLYDHCPELIAAFRRRGDEIIAHGHTNSVRQSDMDEQAEGEMITGVRDRIAREEGNKAPRGWLSPWISESRVTPDLLEEAGFRYNLNWCHDDQPTWMRTRSGGGMWSIPYPQEVNDIPLVVARKASAKEFADAICDAFDEMLRQSSAQSLVFGIALHPYIVGQPHRIGHLRRALEHVVNRAREHGGVWFCTPGDIAAHMDKVMTTETST